MRLFSHEILRLSGVQIYAHQQDQQNPYNKTITKRSFYRRKHKTCRRKQYNHEIKKVMTTLLPSRKAYFNFRFMYSRGC